MPPKSPGTLDVATGNLKPFKATLFLADPISAFGPVQIVAVSSGGLTPPVVGGFSCHLAGARIALVNDHDENADGTEGGPILDETDEVRVVDYLNSPTVVAAAPPGPQRKAAQAASRRALEARTRRMAPYSILSDRRNLTLTLPALVARTAPAPRAALTAGTVRILRPEMPMWMAEVALVGVGREDLEDLLIRRLAQVPGAKADLAFVLQWALQLEWLGPDKDAAGAIAMPAFGLTRARRRSL